MALLITTGLCKTFATPLRMRNYSFWNNVKLVLGSERSVSIFDVLTPFQIQLNMVYTFRNFNLSVLKSTRALPIVLTILDFL